MKSIIIGTAGHVDHGKTTLIKALTGTDTDRLKEEQERGMTIDLGFASLELPDGQHVSIVDVPGHERFIKNMLAGAGGIDIALLVIAADESVMPQTVEHLEILQLLEIKRGIVALTKADMVDDEWLKLAKDDICNALSSTFLAGSPIIPVSSVTGTGLPELLDELQNACDDVETKDSAGPFRLPIDRVFTLTGFGTVVTGTLVAGTIKIGDAVEILPTGFHSRIRQLHVHGKKVESAPAGTRVAVNLVGLEVSDISRGNICATPGTVVESSQFDIKIDLLPTAPKNLKNRSRIRLYTGTSELLGRLLLLDRDELEPGATAYAQFKSETIAAASRGDRFVIRSYSPMVTIGGGFIIDPVAKKHRRFDASVITRLETSSKGTPEELLDQALKHAPFGLTCPEIHKAVDSANVCEIFESLKRQDKVVEIDQGRIMHRYVVDGYIDKVCDTLRAFHDKNPLRPGMQKEELRMSAIKSLDNKSANTLLSYFEKQGLITIHEAWISLAGYKPNLSIEQQAFVDKLLSMLKDAGINVPSLDEILLETGIPNATAKNVIDLLLYRKEIVKVSEDLYFHSETISSVERTLRCYLEKNFKITVSQFRNLTGTSRKYALPMLEYFDQKKVTRRTGDERVLIKTL